MRIAGLPVWVLVLVACAAAPLVIQLWIDAEQRRAKERTRALLRPFSSVPATEGEIVSGTGRATSIERALIEKPSDTNKRDPDDD